MYGYFRIARYSSECIGTPVSINNVCPDASDDDVMFSFDLTAMCVEFEGITEGVDTFCIEVCDANGFCDTTIMIINVFELGLQEPPIAVNDDTTTVINVGVEMDLMLNDTINGQLMDYGVVVNPEHGAISISEDGIFTYTPDDEFCGETDQFIYYIANEYGIDTALVFVDVLCEDLTIFSGFSPNGDGVNDYFTVLGLENYPNHSLIVFNRWGNEVLSSTDYQNDWDGTWDGNDLPTGTYFYVLDDGEGNKYSGYVQINR